MSTAYPYNPRARRGHRDYRPGPDWPPSLDEMVYRNQRPFGMVAWRLRRPTVDECELVGRATGYAKVDFPAFLDDGDTVIETEPNPEAQAALAEALQRFGMCDYAHVIPAGVYLEE